MGGGSHGVWIFNKNDNAGQKNDHPTTKPRPLIDKLVSLFSNEGDLIFDPFLGSGTTAVVAKQGGRPFIGIEISAEYYKIAQDRLSALSEPLF